jgi:pimeloyl-ACP methyl ester carboxylesterase
MNTSAAPFATISPALKPYRSEFVQIRCLRYHVRHWGNEEAPKLFMLHGWMDMSASFQFLVDSLKADWHVIAPDWRGFGLTQASPAHSYWFPDYVADLDILLHIYSPGRPVNLLGHSMGGNVASIYAGVRPQRIAKLINLEGYGLPSVRTEEAPKRYEKWLNELHRPPRALTFATQNEVKTVLRKVNPRLSDERASFLASHWAGRNEEGAWEVLADPIHRNSTPLLYRAEEALACWSAISAPTLWVEAEDTDIWQRLGTSWRVSSAPLLSGELGEEDRAVLESRRVFHAEFAQRLAAIPNVKKIIIKDAGHMLQHDQPEAVASAVESFLAAS